MHSPLHTILNHVIYLHFHWPWKSCELNAQLWSPVCVDIALINKIETKKLKTRTDVEAPLL